MKERYKVFAIMLCLSGVLWFAVDRFVGGTEGLPDALDIRDVSPIDRRAARLEAERLAAEAGPPLETRESLEREPEPVDRGGAEDELTVDSVEAEDPDASEDDEAEEEAPPERPDSDVDTLVRMAEEDIEATVEIEGRDAELARLIEQMDRELLREAPPTRAIDLGLPIAAVRDCPAAAGTRHRTGVLFRHGSAGIKGASLNRIDELLALRQACGGGEIVLEPNPQGDADGGDELRRRRLDEVKYYLLQRRVPGADIAFRERP